MDEPALRYTHLPVLPEETLQYLAPAAGQVVVDGTVGLGGHSRLFAQVLGESGRLICLDRDPEALRMARENLQGVPCRVDFVNTPFEGMREALSGLGLERADRIFLDLGVSSLQLDKPERGFSFRNDGPLDMRMNQSTGPTAADIINTWPVEKLRDLFKNLGEERFSGRIAKRIGERREERPIETTGELSSLVEEAVPFRGRIHPATKVFQALRMEVNDELGTLLRGLAVLGRLLAPDGRLGVLTFHSLEDRLVKRTFQKWQELGAAELVTKRAIAAAREETLENRRARSAKLRVTRRIMKV